MKEAAKKQEEAAAVKKREEEEKEEVKADEMKQEVEPKNEPKAVKLSNEDDQPPEANCFRQKRTAQEMGAIDESSKPKRNKRALLTGENFIKFNSNDDEETAE